MTHFLNENYRYIETMFSTRTSNFIRSSMYGGSSAVEYAVREMTAAGVTVVRHVEWK